MFKPILPLSKVSGWSVVSAAAGSVHTVLCEIQPGPRFDKFVITGNAGTAKKMTDLIADIRVIANDEIVRLHSAAELNAMNVLYGPQYAAVNGNLAAGIFHLPIFMGEPWRKNDEVAERLGWNTRGLRNLRVECDIKADTFTAPQALSFIGIGDYAPEGEPGPMKPFVRIDRTTLNLAIGWNDVMSLPRNGAYTDIHIVSTAITEIELLQGSRKRIGPVTVAQLRADQVHRDMEPVYRGYATTTGFGSVDNAAVRGMTDVVMDPSDRIDSALVVNPNEDFNLRLNSTAAGGVACLYKRLTEL